MTAAERYARSDAKAWARANFTGVCNVILPSFNADLRGLNEAAIRHDVRRNIELGFWGALLVSECGTTVEEMRQFAEIAVDEAAGRHYFLLHGSFDTLQDTLRAAKDAQDVGVDGLLMAYPNSFYPRSADDLTNYTREVVRAVDLAVVLFCAPHFNMARHHPSGFPLTAWDVLADEENVVAIKYEVGHPGVVGSLEALKRFEQRGLLVCDPYEPNLPVWDALFQIPWIGTSNYEYYADVIPRLHALLRQGQRSEALDLYWRLQPAREAREQLRTGAAGANFNHRYMWKYMAWLNGYNGGPLRMPAMKLTDGQMRRAGDALVAAGILDQAPHDHGDFFVGRNPA